MSSESSSKFVIRIKVDHNDIVRVLYGDKANF